jgi:hypothetical protein
MKKKQITQPIVNIAREYAEKTFTKEFLETCTDSWYFDALDWFEYTYKTTNAQRNEFSGKIQYQFNRYYIRVFGKRDDYYHLKGVITDLKKLHQQIEGILANGTMKPHGITLQDTLKKLTNMQFSLGLVVSAVNRKYKFEEK